MGEYRLEAASLTVAEIAQTSALLRLVFPHARHLTPAYLDWAYVRNPQGRVVASNAYHGDALVGHLAAIPLRAAVEGGAAAGMILQNSAIHPEHRGRRLQSLLSEAMFEEGLGRSYSFAVAVGNRYSTGPLLTRFKMLKPLEARLGAGPLRRRAAAPAASFEGLWDERTLAWRLGDPERRYSVRDGQVLASTGVPGIAAILHEHVALGDAGPRPSGPLRLYLGLDPALDLGRSAYLPIPMRLRRSPLNFVWRDLHQRNYLPDAQRVLFRALDFDAY